MAAAQRAERNRFDLPAMCLRAPICFQRVAATPASSPARANHETEQAAQAPAHRGSPLLALTGKGARDYSRACSFGLGHGFSRSHNEMDASR